MDEKKSKIKKHLGAEPLKIVSDICENCPQVIGPYYHVEGGGVQLVAPLLNVQIDSSLSIAIKQVGKVL